MTIQMDNVGIVVDDMDTMIAFLVELGMELEGKALIEGEWSGRVVGVPGQRVDIAMMRIPGAPGRIELSKYRTPEAVSGVPVDAPANTLGIRRVMFEVDDIDDVVARLCALGGELVGEIVRYKDAYRLCYLRGPEGIVFGLAEELH